MNNTNNTEDFKNKKSLQFTVNGKEYAWSQQYVSGKEIREISSAPASCFESQLFLAINRPWEDELINDNTTVNLARPELEHFYFKNILSLIINGKEFTWDKEYITGIELKNLAGIAQTDELYLSIRKPWEDEPIHDDTVVNLARPGIEHFHSKKPVTYKFFIEKKDYYSPKSQLSVGDILTEYAKVPTNNHTLAEKKGSGFIEYENLDELMDLTQIRHFSVLNDDSTTVS